MVSGEFRWHLSRGVPLYEGDRIVQWFGTATDIHSVKTAEQELQTAARHKDEFLAVLAHELRNPLAPMRNALELVRGMHDDSGSTRLYGILDRQIAHMVRLVDDLLEVSRISRGALRLERASVSIEQMLDAAVESVGPQLSASGHVLERTMVPATVTVHGDAVRLAQAVGNLLHNAIKFTPAGGRLALHTSWNASEVAITVSDTGIGFDPQIRDEIFEMFVQGPPADRAIRSGLGVGLALVRRIVELHGGSVTADSVGRGQGSRFIMRLPRAVDSPRAG
jgi:signal transduction histidine kinase